MITWCAAGLFGATAVAIAGLLRLRRAYAVVTVEGLSMRPKYQPGDRVLVRCRTRTLGRGDEVVVESPDRKTMLWHSPPRPPGRAGTGLSERQWLIKRVAGVSGDPWPESGADLIPPDHLFLLGDDAAVSFDSRQVGLFGTDRVLGKVCRRL